MERIEVNPEKEKDYQKLEEHLHKIMDAEAAEQFLFVLHRMATYDFINQCKEATRQFGHSLMTRYGGEESFFDLMPEGKYADVRCNTSMEKFSYPGKFHSIGMLHYRNRNQYPHTLFIDLTFGRVAGRQNQEQILVVHVPLPADRAIQELEKVYGGQWHAEYLLSSSGTFTYIPGS